MPESAIFPKLRTLGIAALHVSAACFGLLCLVSGCGKSDGPAAAGNTGVRLGKVTSIFPADDSPVQRLTSVVNAPENDAASEPIRFGPEHLHFKTIAGPDGEPLSAWEVDLSGGIDSAPFQEARVRMRVSEGSQARLTWRGNLEPTYAQNPGVYVPVVAGEDVQEYVFSLQPIHAEYWLGVVNGLAVVPSDPNAECEIESITLSAIPDVAPRRTTIDNVTMESIFGDNIAWEVDVPQRAIFETHVGLLPRAWEELKSDGVHVGVHVVIDGKVVQTAVSRTLEPMTNSGDRVWVPIRADLNEFAGKHVVLNLTANGRSTAVGDYVLWGNPTVFSSDPADDATPIILISCDTMRADHLSCYGYSRNTSPNLDEFAQDAVVYENAVTPETWTLTAHLTMLTGLHPLHHGVTANINLDESVDTLPELLRAHGYMTAGFTGYQAWMPPWRGFSHGFDLYSTPPIVRDVFSTLPLIEQWLDGHPSGKNFLFFHNFDAHSRFQEIQCKDCELVYYPPNDDYRFFSKDMSEPPKLRRPERARGTGLLWALLEKRDSLSEEELTYLTALYDDCLRAVDDSLGQFFAYLKERSLYDRAMIVVTADHGELFGENGEYMHIHVYEGALRVPLLVKFPGKEFAGKRVSEMVQLADLMPTILDIAGLPVPSTDGQSLHERLNEEGVPLPYAFARRFKHQAVRTNDWKLIRNTDSNSFELYNLAIDPIETRNVYDENPPPLGAMVAELRRFFQADPRGYHIAVQSHDADWRGVLTISTDDRFETTRLLYGESMGKQELMTSDDQNATVTLGVLDREELVVRTVAPDAGVRLNISSDQPFAVSIDGSPPVSEMQFATILKPTEFPARLSPPIIPMKADTALILIWRVEGTAGGDEARPLTEEEKIQLNSLGYGATG